MTMGSWQLGQQEEPLPSQAAAPAAESEEEEEEEEEDSICPISQECRVPPRRSIHLERPRKQQQQPREPCQDSAHVQHGGQQAQQGAAVVAAPAAVGAGGDPAGSSGLMVLSSRCDSAMQSSDGSAESPTLGAASAASSRATGAAAEAAAAAAAAGMTGAAAAAAGGEGQHTPQQQLAGACTSLDLKGIRSCLAADCRLARCTLTPAGASPLLLVVQQLAFIPQPLNPAMLEGKRGSSGTGGGVPGPSAAATARAVAAAVADVELPAFSPTMVDQQMQLLPGEGGSSSQQLQQQHPCSFLELESPSSPAASAGASGSGCLGGLLSCFGSRRAAAAAAGAGEASKDPDAPLGAAAKGRSTAPAPGTGQGPQQQQQQQESGPCSLRRSSSGSSGRGSAAAAARPRSQQLAGLMGGNGALVSAALQLLLSAGADANLRDHQGLTPLLAVAQERFVTPDKGLAVLRAAKLLTQGRFVEVNARDALGRSPMALVVLSLPREPPQEAVRRVQEALLQLLLSAGVDPNGPDGEGLTPLMHAAAAGCKWVCKLLLQAGASARAVDNQGRSALAHALLQAAKEGQLALLGSVVDVHRGSGVVEGSVKGGGGRVLLLQEAVVDAIRQQAIMSTTHQHHQQYKGPRGWLGRGSGVGGGGSFTSSASSGDGGGKWDPQGFAAGSSGGGGGDGGGCSRGSERGLHRSSLSSLSSYSSASRQVQQQLEGHLGVIRLLCSYGALDPHPSRVNTPFPGLDGRTQLHIAVRRGDLRGVQMLLAGGAEPDARDIYGNVPLFYWGLIPEVEEAAAIAEALLLAGADPNAANLDGLQPLDLACHMDRWGHVSVASHLVPIHALLVGFGGKNSRAFKVNPELLRSSKNSSRVLVSGSTFPSVHHVPPGIGGGGLAAAAAAGAPGAMGPIPEASR